MIINVTYDASVNKCPQQAAFEACVQGVVAFYEAQFTDPITINIHVGFGEVDGFRLPPGSGAASVSNYTTTNFTYAQIRAALAARATSADDKTALASLGATDPTGGGVFNMTLAEAKALGLMGASSAVDGYVGIDSSNSWIFNTTNTDGADVPSGNADAFSFLAHEFAEVMGRQMNFSPSDPANFGGGYYPYDLFDYTAPGARSFTSTVSDRYFSINGGISNTGQHYFNNDPNSGDGFDWLPNGQPGSFLPTGAADSFDYYGSIGIVSGADLRLMDILGYTPTLNFTWQSQVSGAFTTAAEWTAGVVPGAADSAILNAPGSTNYTVTVSASRTVASLQVGSTANLSIASGIFTVSGGADSSVAGRVSGAGTLALAGGGAAAFTSGSVLTVTNVSLNGSGTTATITDPILAYAGTWTQAGGTTLLVAAGDRVNFSGAGDTFSGTLTGAGTVAFIHGSDFLSGGTLSAAGVIINGASVTLAGSITNKSAVAVTTPSLTVAATGASLFGGGSINLSNIATNEIIGATTSATLTNVNDRITGAGALGGGRMVLVNKAGGKIIGNDSNGLTIDTGAATITNIGLIENTGAGGVTVKSAINNTGSLVVTAGTLTLDGTVSGSGVVLISGGVADVATASFTESVRFTGTTGLLQLAGSRTYSGQITGFSKSGTTSLDLLDIGFTSGVTKATFAGTTTSGVLTVTDGAHTAKITLEGDYLASTFTTSSDGHGGTKVVDPPSPAPAAVVPLVTAMAAFGAAAAGHVTRLPNFSPARAVLASPTIRVA